MTATATKKGKEATHCYIAGTAWKAPKWSHRTCRTTSGCSAGTPQTDALDLSHAASSKPSQCARGMAAIQPHYHTGCWAAMSSLLSVSRAESAGWHSRSCSQGWPGLCRAFVLSHPAQPLSCCCFLSNFLLPPSWPWPLYLRALPHTSTSSSNTGLQVELEIILQLYN